MLDTVIRMVDAQGDELAAADFMPAAVRNRMLRSIDRWVIGATLAFCATQPVDTVFVKLSSESLIDKTLTDWLAKAVDSSGVAHGKLCFQVSEEDAAQFLAQTKTLADQLKKQGHSSRSSTSVSVTTRRACSRALRCTTSRSTAR